MIETRQFNDADFFNFSIVSFDFTDAALCAAVNKFNLGARENVGAEVDISSPFRKSL